MDNKFIIQMSKIKIIMEKIVFCILSVILLVILSLVVWQVISRYLIGKPAVFTEELVIYFLLWLGCFSAVFAFGEYRHIALTYYFDKFSPTVRKYITLFHFALILMFAILFFIVGGSALTNIAKVQVSAVLGIPMKYIYVVFPICGCILTTYTVIDIANLLLSKKGE